MGNVLYTKEKTVEQMGEIATSPYVKDFTEERKRALLDLLVSKEGKDVIVLRFTQSLCPECVETGKFDKMKIDSVVFAKNNKVWQIKQCREHGVNKSLYWGDYDIYKKAEGFQDPGIKILNPNIDKNEFEISCPEDCGLCVEHESHTGLGNIVVTNRCDLTCWYCFFYAKEGDAVYEPTIDQIKFMLKRMKDEKPVGANAVQLTGGEPTLRPDIIDIIKVAREIGYDHVQLNTNGINLSKSLDFCKQVKEAGSHVLYMSFDGMTPQTNPKNYWEAQKAINNCNKAGIGVVLVPTVIGGINDHELGDIIRFGFGNLETVRSVNFQPVSLVGRMPDRMRMQQRITIPTCMKRIEEQTNGEIGKEFWFPIPCSKQITDFVEAIKQKPKYRLSVHFSCGMATYVFKDGDKMVPLGKFFDVEGFFNYLGDLTKEINESRARKVKVPVVMAKLMKNLNKYVDNEKKPKDLKFVRMLAGALTGGNYSGLADLHHSSLFLGMMHFQDPNNWDLDRIHKCDIHYATPDGRILPFCTFNVIPELYRDKVQRKFSIPSEEWEAKTGKRINDDKHRRKLRPEEMKEIAVEYDKYRLVKDKPKLEPDWGYQNINDWESGNKEKALAKINEAANAVIGNPGTNTKPPSGGCSC